MNRDSTRRWVHSVAIVLCCATFPLIWVGGLVTTYDAGMAVHDWPTTYGYNLFLYPWTTWIQAPWDLFIEHGHRLWAAAVGLLTIALVATTWASPQRAWLRWMACGALVLVILQGLLGGARVLLDARLLAMLHACLGPAFFAYCVALAVCTSRFWSEPPAAPARLKSSALPRLALVMTLLSYLQLVLGAQLRHTPLAWTPTAFQVAVGFHVFIAAVLLIHVVWLAVLAANHCGGLPALRNPALLLATVVLVQLVLGGSTWIAKYGWPTWFNEWRVAAAYTVQANSLWQATTVTAHVAMGSLILGISLLVALRSFRLIRSEATALGSSALFVGMAT